MRKQRSAYFEKCAGIHGSIKCISMFGLFTLNNYLFCFWVRSICVPCKDSVLHTHTSDNLPILDPQTFSSLIGLLGYNVIVAVTLI